VEKKNRGLWTLGNKGTADEKEDVRGKNWKGQNTRTLRGRVYAANPNAECPFKSPEGGRINN